jgi:hypothetical protein
VVSFGQASVRSICCEIEQKKNIRGAPERGEGGRRERKGRRLPMATNSSREACRCCGDSARNSASWRRLGQKEERGSGEVSVGVI